MPKLTIDGKLVEVDDGSTILDAARKIGIDIPTLCYLEGIEPRTSCMVCVVKVKGVARFLPSCATVVRDGMVVESESEEVRHERRRALELLLGDHVGDCEAPCESACPAGMDIPRMLRAVVKGDFSEALFIANSSIVIPSVLGHICPAPCEKACRRKDCDDSVSIRVLHGSLAILTGNDSFRDLITTRIKTGKNVAVIGSGPAGLSAAYHLMHMGHGCHIFEIEDSPGGALLGMINRNELPPDALTLDLQLLDAMGIEYHFGVEVGRDTTFREIRSEFDAVIVATGEMRKCSPFGLGHKTDGLEVFSPTLATASPGVFAAGGVVRPIRMAVQSVAMGRQAAHSANLFLLGHKPEPLTRSLTVRMGRCNEEELGRFMEGTSSADRIDTGGRYFSEQEANAEAERCLHCDCRKDNNCRLRSEAEKYGAEPGRFKLDRKIFDFDATHPDFIFEPGKCIDCGICVAIAERERERLGLSFVGRGFDVRVAAPLEKEMREALTHAAHECVEKCPTGALAFRD